MACVTVIHLIRSNEVPQTADHDWQRKTPFTASASNGSAEEYPPTRTTRPLGN